MREAASDVWSTPHERVAPKQTARQAAALRVSTIWPRLLRCSPCEYAWAIRCGSRLASGAISSETRLTRGSASACRQADAGPESAGGARYEIIADRVPSAHRP